MSDELKQAILIRTDLRMSVGKIAAQAAHASSEATLQAYVRGDIRGPTFAKVVLRVSSKDELLSILDKAHAEDLVTVSIADAGRTQVHPGTITCGAIGPCPDYALARITSELKLF